MADETSPKSSNLERAALGIVEDLQARVEARADARSRAREREGTLVEQAKTGDNDAFRKLVEQNQGRLYAVALGMLRDRDEAMDVVQDTFIKAHRKLPEFEGQAAFSTWIYRICVNICIDKQRSRSRRPSIDIDDVAGKNLDDDTVYGSLEITPQFGGGNPLKTASAKELGREIERCLAGISDEHRAVLLLREVEGMSYQEISDTLDVPKGTVMSRLFHARKRMQELLTPYLRAEPSTENGGSSDEI